MNKIGVCVIGDDKRMDFVAEQFYDTGYDVSRNISDIPNNQIIILGPVMDENTDKQIRDLLVYNQLLYGGRLSNKLLHECELKNVRVYKYLENQELIVKNAELTAKGIMRQAVKAKCVPEESHSLVVGYGSCGKAIARELKAAKANVDIMARNNKLEPEILKEGYGFVPFSKATDVGMNKYSYVFNTVPALVIDKKIIACFSKSVMIFDIASKPGGVDFSYCEENNIFAFLSLGIPGKEYPVEAGKIIAHTILNDLENI